MNARGRAAVASVTTTAPLEPNTVYYFLTATPIELVNAQPSAESAVSAGAHRIPTRPGSSDACATPIASPQIAPWTTMSPRLVP